MMKSIKFMVVSPGIYYIRSSLKKKSRTPLSRNHHPFS
jgi:hypothetical protein